MRFGFGVSLTVINKGKGGSFFCLVKEDVGLNAGVLLLSGWALFGPCKHLCLWWVNFELVANPPAAWPNRLYDWVCGVLVY